jgi:hypothetical protein
MTIRLYKVTADFRCQDFKDFQQKSYIVIASSREDAINRTRTWLLDGGMDLAEFSITALRATEFPDADFAELPHGS